MNDKTSVLNKSMKKSEEKRPTKKKLLVDRDLMVNTTGHLMNVTGYIAKNVSSDFDFTKEFLPSAAPSTPPTTFPSASPSYIPLPSTIRACPGQTPEMIANDFAKYELRFDYEIVTSFGQTSVNDALEALENRVLDDVATNFLSCENRRTTINRRLQEPGDIVRIDSFPNDVEDIFNVECIHDTGVADAGDVKCTPILGSMTFYSDCPSCSFAETDILNSIKEGCDNNLYVDENVVKQVNFIGIRDSPVVARVTSTTPKKPIGLGISYAAFVLTAIAAMTLLVKTRRNKHKKLPLGDAEDSDTLSYEADLNMNKNPRTINLSELLAVEEEEEGGFSVNPVSSMFKNLGLMT